MSTVALCSWWYFSIGLTHSWQNHYHLLALFFPDQHLHSNVQVYFNVCLMDTISFRFSLKINCSQLIFPNLEWVNKHTFFTGGVGGEPNTTNRLAFRTSHFLSRSPRKPCSHHTIHYNHFCIHYVHISSHRCHWQTWPPRQEARGGHTELRWRRQGRGKALQAPEKWRKSGKLQWHGSRRGRRGWSIAGEACKNIFQEEETVKGEVRERSVTPRFAHRSRWTHVLPVRTGVVRWDDRLR